MVLDSGSSVRPFASSSFSAQSGTQPFVHHGGEICFLAEWGLREKIFRSFWNGYNCVCSVVFFRGAVFWDLLVSLGNNVCKSFSCTWNVDCVGPSIFLSAAVCAAGTLQGLHNLQANYSMQSVQNALSSRNQGMAGGPSTGTHQPAGGRYSSNSLPVGLPQVHHAHSSLERKTFALHVLKSYFHKRPWCTMLI